jgi:hypothetical protein
MSASHADCLTTRIGGWWDRTVILNDLEKRQNSCPCWESNPISSSPSPSHYLTMLSQGLFTTSIADKSLYHSAEGKNVIWISLRSNAFDNRISI